jgi:putative membrane protein
MRLYEQGAESRRGISGRQPKHNPDRVDGRTMHQNGASFASTVIAGGMGGFVGSSCMTVVRTLAQRAGFIDKTVPQIIEEWASHELQVGPPGGALGHHVVDQALHHGYGAVWGALYGASLGQRQRSPALRGAAFGLGLWAFGFFVLIPALRVHRSADQAGWAENAVNAGAHILYGLVVALLTDEIAHQTQHGPTSEPDRKATAVG